MGESAETAVPVLWLLLRPSRLGSPAELPAEELGAPLQARQRYVSVETDVWILKSKRGLHVLLLETNTRHGEAHGT